MVPTYAQSTVRSITKLRTVFRPLGPAPKRGLFSGALLWGSCSHSPPHRPRSSGDKDACLFVVHTPFHSEDVASGLLFPMTLDPLPRPAWTSFLQWQSTGQLPSLCTPCPPNGQGEAGLNPTGFASTLTFCGCKHDWKKTNKKTHEGTESRNSEWTNSEKTVI